jgi:hypothetical protein
MILHTELGSTAFSRSKRLLNLIHNQAITLGGNCKLKIYGRLNCRAGKRMKVENRVFFQNESEALENGYRPCAVCMREAYQRWKLQNL